MIKRWLQKNKRDIAVIVLLLIMAGIPRLLDLGTYLTADEKNWMGRSYEFIRAFKDFRFNDMLQTSHPGVTTMWLVGSAITAKMLVSHIPFTFRNLSHFAAASQFPIALITTLSIPVIYLLLRKLLNRSVAVAAALLIALDPFLIGYSRVAHVDALLAHLLFMAALALMIWRQSHYSQRWLVIAAVISGLAVLTKAPAIFLLPFMGLIVLTDRQAWQSRSFVNERVKDAITWLLIVGLMFVIIWPAILWVPNPEGNVLVLKRDLGIAAITPHHMVEDYTLNPWHYPAALLTRTTPVTLIASLFFVGWLIWHAIRARGTRHEARETGSPSSLLVTRYSLLAAYIFFFILMMTLGAKKGDRYILPVWPAIDTLAAAGLVVVGMRVQSIFQRQAAQAERAGVTPGVTSEAEELVKNFPLGKFKRPGLGNALILGIPIVYLIFVTYSYHPYAIAYSNPLFPDNLSQELGWGEGLEQVAVWLNENAPNAVVASWYPEELGAYTSSSVAHINAHEQGQVRFVVLYKNMFGRAPDHYANDFIDEYYQKREPVFVARVAGKEFAWVYEKRVFERIVGELTPGKRVGQEIAVTHNALAALDILPATYSGKATSGTLQVMLRRGIGGKVLEQWTVPVAQLEDDRWRTVKLDTPLSLTGSSVFIEVFAIDTEAGNAPTLRYTSDYDYRTSNMYVATDGIFNDASHKTGDLAIRLRYQSGKELANEEETKLLP